MRCLGTLEFLCDFYERSHLTQKELLEANQNEAEGKIQEDAEADKENAAPIINEGKRKLKALSTESPKSTKRFLTENNMSHYRNERKEESCNHIDSSEYTNNIQPVVKSTVQLSNVISSGKVLKDDQSGINKLKSLMAKKDEKTVVCATWPLKIMNSNQENEASNILNSKLSQRRKRGRKSKLEKMRENTGDSRNDNFNDNCKEYFLPTICPGSKSNSMANSSVIASKLQVEQVIAKEEEAIIDMPLNVAHAKSSETNITYNDNMVVNNVVEVETEFNDEKNENSNNCSENTKYESETSKPISVTIKQEKEETENVSSKFNEKSDQFASIPSEVMSQSDQNLISRQNKVVNGEETRAEMTVASITKKSESNKTDMIVEHTTNVTEYSDVRVPKDNGIESKMFTEQNRGTVIKSPQSDNLPDLNITQESSTGLSIALNRVGQSPKSEIESNFDERSESRRFSRTNFDESKRRSFSRISELISDEQKLAIETYYTVNMSMVNQEEVQKNITIVDKKNVRCNICGSLYLRMDKCQVHIWGHLQMKPYQCKACDFSTVTVSNVRCHIRKSHLKIKPFACHLCEKRYVTAILLEEHINTHTGARPYKCKICDFASSSRQILSYHNATHKPHKDINCKLCGKEFYSKSRLRAHMIVHKKDKVVMCKLCSAYLANAESLEMHHKNVHMQDYVCNICGKQVKSRKALHNHQNVHSAAKYKCTLCPNVYKSSQILKEHLLKHEGIRKYKCSVCQKSFGQQSHLAAHMAVHSKIRFHCPGCDKPFNRQDNMKIHTKRCKHFLANPDLKSLLIKRERTISFNNATELTTELKHGMSSSVFHISLKDQENVLAKTAKEQEKAPLNLCKLGLNISCIEHKDKIWDRDNSNEKDVMSTKINVIEITDVNDRIVPENENLPVLESVLGPESY